MTIRPGIALRIETDALDALHVELDTKEYRHARPGVESMPWNCRETTLRDPFGNRLAFTDAAGRAVMFPPGALSCR